MSRAYRRRQRNASSSMAWVDRIWQEVTRPTLLGVILAVAGILAMSAPWLKIPARKIPGWWAMPVQATDVLQVIVLLGTAVVVLGAGLCAQALLSRTRSRPIVLSVLVMGAGAVGCVACWLSLQSEVPATQANFGTGQQVEYIVGRVRGEPVRVMLPRRVKVEQLVATAPASLTFTLSRPKQTDASPTKLAVGESVDVEGTRFTFIGSSIDVQQLQGVIAGTSSQSIAAAARKGASLRVTLDGPEYNVKDISLNYMGMGPAVQLATADEASFWVFQREPEASGKVFDHGLQLLRVESMPAAVMTVGPARDFESLAACGGLFMLGLGGLLLWGTGPAMAVVSVSARKEDDPALEEEE